MQIKLAHADIGGFRASVTQLLAHQVHPAAIEWSALPPATGAHEQLQRAVRVSAATAAVIPRSFLGVVDLVLLHTDPQRFDLLYRLLWRLVHEPRLKNDAADYDMQRARKMAHAVRRDLHRLKTQVEFHAIEVAGRRTNCAWAAPAHFTTEAFALWQARRTPGSDFLIATPERVVFYREAVMQHLPPLAGAPADPAAWTRLLATV